MRPSTQRRADPGGAGGSNARCPIREPSYKQALLSSLCKSPFGRFQSKAKIYSRIAEINDCADENIAYMSEYVIVLFVLFFCF
jgi:hypothetical protein